MRLATAVVILWVMLPALAYASSSSVSDADAKIRAVESDLGRLRAEYAVLSDQARTAAKATDAARLRTVNLAREISSANAALSAAREAVAERAVMAYKGRSLGALDVALRIRDYAQVDAYLPYVTRPLEEDRRTVEVYRQRVRALQGLEKELDDARSSGDRSAADLSIVEQRLTANLRRQQDELAAAKRALAAARAEEIAAARSATERAALDAAFVRAPAPSAAGSAIAAPGSLGGAILVGPQAGSGPGPGPNTPEVTDVPPAPASLANGVALGPTAGIPIGLKTTKITFGCVSSWYGPGFHGWTTANGEPYDQYGFTVASPDLAFETILLLSFEARQVLVRVNDRGPYVEDRCLDLSKGAADAVGLSGIGWVEAEILI